MFFKILLINNNSKKGKRKKNGLLYLFMYMFEKILIACT